MVCVAPHSTRREEAGNTVQAIRAAGGQAFALPLDVGRTEQFPGFRDDLLRTIGEQWSATTVHALVNNAGFGGGYPFAEMTEEAFDDYYRVLLRGPSFLRTEEGRVGKECVSTG